MKELRTTPSRLVTCFCVLMSAVIAAQTPKPKRINRAIELLEQDQPVYFFTTDSGSYEKGLKDAQTYADYIAYDMEHPAYDIKGLSDYMRGLAAGGPTKSGHRTPPVIVNAPVNGFDEAAVRANSWMFNQILATGVHGVMLTHAVTPGAIGAFVESVRLPIHRQAVDHGLGEGRRGVHGAPIASQIWGVSQDEYFDKADAWPLNPNGELLLGVKLENKYAMANTEQNLRVPGIAFAEGGPSDLALSLGIRTRGAERDALPEMIAARARVMAACKANKIFFVDGLNPTNVTAKLQEGVMFGSADQQTAEIGRRFTKRQGS